MRARGTRPAESKPSKERLCFRQLPTPGISFLAGSGGRGERELGPPLPKMTRLSSLRLGRSWGSAHRTAVEKPRPGTVGGLRDHGVSPAGECGVGSGRATPLLPQGARPAGSCTAHAHVGCSRPVSRVKDAGAIPGGLGRGLRSHLCRHPAHTPEGGRVRSGVTVPTPVLVVQPEREAGRRAGGLSLARCSGIQKYFLMFCCLNI